MRKLLKRNAKRLIAMMLCLIMIIGIMPTTALAVTDVEIVFKGYVTYGATSVGYFIVNGEQAFCIEHTKSSPQTGGQTSIKGGDTFYLSAPLDYGGTFSTGELKGTMKEWAAIVYTTGSSGAQNLSQGVWTDSIKTTPSRRSSRCGRAMSSSLRPPRVASCPG